MHPRPAEQLAHVVGVDASASTVSPAASLPRDLARDRADLPLELAHAALARVAR